MPHGKRSASLPPPQPNSINLRKHSSASSAPSPSAPNSPPPSRPGRCVGSLGYQTSERLTEGHHRYSRTAWRLRTKSLSRVNSLSAPPRPRNAGQTWVCVAAADCVCAGATKVKLAAPKPKYIEHLLMATEVSPLLPLRWHDGVSWG
jgi:hypothetical protein